MFRSINLFHAGLQYCLDIVNMKTHLELDPERELVLKLTCLHLSELQDLNLLCPAAK